MLGCYLPYLKDTPAKVGPPGKNGQSWDPRGQDFRGKPLPHKPWDQEVKWPRGCNRLDKALVSAQLGLDSFQKLSTPSSLQKSCLLSRTQTWHRKSDPVRCLWCSMLSFPEVTAFSVRTMKITWCFTKGGERGVYYMTKETYIHYKNFRKDRQAKEIPWRKPLPWFCQPEKAVFNGKKWFINDGTWSIFRNFLGEKLQ